MQDTTAVQVVAPTAATNKAGSTSHSQRQFFLLRPDAIHVAFEVLDNFIMRELGQAYSIYLTLLSRVRSTSQESFTDVGHDIVAAAPASVIASLAGATDNELCDCLQLLERCGWVRRLWVDAPAELVFLVGMRSATAHEEDHLFASESVQRVVDAHADLAREVLLAHRSRGGRRQPTLRARLAATRSALVTPYSPERATP